MMSLEEVDDLCLLTGGVKFRDDKKWKRRHATLRRLSPVANTLHLQLFKEGPRGLQSKASLSLDNFRAIETGFTLDRESNTLALLCDGSSIVLAFDAREALIQWQVKIAASVPYVQQFSAQLLVTPARCKISPGAARLHVQDLRVSLVMGALPRLVATWAIADLRRYGPAEGKYVLEGGSRCGRAEGLYVLGVSGGQASTIHTAVEEAAQCRLQARRKLIRKQDDSPCGMSRRTVSRSCSRDSTITRSRDSGLCRQASLQWSACSSDDCDLSSDPSAVHFAASEVCRPCGDGQSEVSAGSSGSDSAAGRLPPYPGSGSVCGRLPRSGSSSGPSLRSPRPGRRCSADCACAVKISRSTLRKTGVLDGVEELGRGRTALAPMSPPPGARYVDHVYEEPGEKPINGCHTSHRPITSCGTPDRPITAHDATPLRPITACDPSGRPITTCDPSGRVVHTVAEVHGCDPALAGYDRPRPALPAIPSTSSPSPASSSTSGSRLSPEGVSEHLYEDPGPSEGWYQTPRPCAVCRSRSQETGQEQEGVYRQPACPCLTCGGHKEKEREVKHRVDGSGRMPVMNADTGQLELPAEPLPASDQLCPQIPSEQILDTGLYSQPARPAYAVVDRSKRGAPLLPGLPPPPPLINTAPAEPQYANTPPAPPSGDPTYVNCGQKAIGGGTGIEGANGKDCAVAHGSGVKDAINYVNCSPAAAQLQQQQCHHNQQQHQPLYVNTPACLAVSPTVPHPPGDYLPMGPPSGTNPPPRAGEDYLEMSSRPGRAALRRSRSVDNGRQMALRSASLGRRPMPSPKPERFRNLVMARGPGQVARMGEGERSATLPGDSRNSSGCLCETPVTSPPAAPVTSQQRPPLQLADPDPAGPEARQAPLSARLGTSSSPRVALLSQKPRSGPEYRCLDRRQLLAQMSEPGPSTASERGYSVDI